MAELSIPELSLVALIGCTGSGKSTFARTHFLATSIVSSDACRGIVSDDENDQSATADAFALVHHIAGVRLRRGLRTVVDATNVQPMARQELVRVAREHDVLPVAIVLDVPERVCLERNATRPDRAHLGRHVVARQQRDLRRSLRGLEREGFRRVYVLRGVEEIAAATVVDEKAWNDRRELTGPFDVIGDVHGCRAELETLLGELGYLLRRDDAGRPVDAHHPGGRTAIFVGDLVDRGPDTPGVLRLVMGMVAAGHALCVTGNHEHKLVRALDGKRARVAHGLAESLAQLEAEGEEFRKAAHEFCRGLVSHYVLDGGALVVAHAGLKQEYHGRASGRVRSFAMYGETTGETDEYGLPVRYPWAEDYRGRATVLYGHTPITELRWVNNTLCLDTGAVFGGRLTALRYPEREPVSVPAQQVWYEPARPLDTPAPTGAVVRRDPGVLDLDDVIGRRVVATRHLGRVSVQEENASAALEVMSRFAVDPRWLIYLPPTMSPCATADSGDLLEHPAQVFGYYRAEGVTSVVCEEKHMGSRAVAVVARSAQAARDRFAVADGGTGALYTRTGRPFFDDPARTEAVLARVRAAAERAGLFDALDTSWLALDAELLPWSAKAMGLLREQYAAVGAAARAALGAATDVLAAAAERGLDVGELADRTGVRRVDADAFTAAYGRYCWPVDGLDGVRLAPFQILAAEGANHAIRDHDWHLRQLDTLVAADPDLFAPTRRVFVDLTVPEDESAATAWWTELTAAGGEGMVVKPADSLAFSPTAPGRPIQPGMKCRGPEYLRIIYGPEYRHPANLSRLRSRGLGRKRALALREYALGLESLDRFVSGDPLWRVHEAVFAVLALESEPVDPRL
ncbi:polynucleotide kinase-phosphatase [Nocardia terpenica]|uniref:Polynucleotide kinase-phosphatase n=1 Tax=Nocardia terpenica TaxID=455432 RepID=A0A161Z6W3_9NOCA|nr:polynucleotide kinase-phosphatase [Nocardia terpenica]KZM75794.1 polynucleotide kinase-phosphatase [Nocardia terpenica]NQE86314.1 polynucleotide kinase-phosphatase [Nocardia terpenica]